MTGTEEAIDHWVNDIHQGDATDVLSEMPADSVHFVMTSPPYWGLRDYGVEGQLGLEASIDEYLAALLEVFEEIQRVLRPDGTFWLNIGDRYATKKPPGNPGDYSTSTLHGGDISDWYSNTLSNTEDEARDSLGQGPPEKSLLLLPDRVRLAMVEQGWIIRGAYPWIKDKPDAAEDRFRKGPETVIQASVEKHYWHDLRHFKDHGWFDIAPAQYPDAHYATFPEALVERPVRATCPPEVCSDCGTPYEPTFRQADPFESDGRPQRKKAIERAKQAGLTKEHLAAARAVGFSDAGAGKATQNGAGNNSDETTKLAKEAKEVLGGYFREFTGRRRRFDGWEKHCDCNTTETQSGIVLEPFAGSGTTCMVAKDLGRRFVGIELNPEYVAMAQSRAGLTVDEPERLLEDSETSLTAYADGGGPSE